VEVAVKRAISGMNVPQRGALANPDSIDLYYNIPQLQDYWNVTKPTVAKQWPHMVLWGPDKQEIFIETSSLLITTRSTINIVRKSCRKHFWLVSPLICFPLWLDKVMIVSPSICFPLWLDKVVIVFIRTAESLMWCCFSVVSRSFARGIDKRHSEANLINK
jgi:hypothetical protein